MCGKVLYLIAQPIVLDVLLEILQLYAIAVEFKLCIVKCRNMLRAVMSMVQILIHSKGTRLRKMRQHLELQFPRS